MNLKCNITNTRMPIRGTARKTALWLAVTVFFLVAPVFAHEGFEHVLGTVAKISGNVLTVKTAKGNVDVKLDDKTEFTKNGQKALAADLKLGMRVVVDVPVGRKEKIAHSVKIGTAIPTGQDAPK
jgi:hypothetical protein